MLKKTFVSLICAGALGITFVFSLATIASAQSLFSTAIKVNDRAITHYEIGQRTRLLTVLQSFGDPIKTARKQLIEERLQLEAAEIIGLTITEEELQSGVAEFAARASMEGEEFLNALEQEGVDRQTFLDFVRAGIIWRSVINARFGGRVQITEAEIDRALAANTGGLRVLLSEIIIPITPQTADQVNTLARNIAELRNFQEFADAARQYSVSPSRNNGGEIPWTPINNLPQALRPIISGLVPGAVTDPVPLPNGNAIALFQLRGVEETSVTTPSFAAIDYATYRIPGGRSPEALTRAQDIMSRNDTCDDLYAEALGQPENTLVRGAVKPSEIPNDVASELARLDRHEYSTSVTRDNGQTLLLLMMCNRTADANADASREEVGRALRGQRLNSFANSYLAQLHADAIISEE